MKTKTAELTDLALDWAVAKCEGHLTGGHFHYVELPFVKVERGQLVTPLFEGRDEETVFWNPSTDWSQGGPIIECERILVLPEIGKEDAGNAWSAVSLAGHEAFGPTPLIAAMRCYAASKLGAEVDVPEELL